MELTPQSVRTASFKTVKKGYDPFEVDSFKSQVASAIETAQNQATAMEARARAAVSKLQELTQAGGKDAGSSTPPAGTPAGTGPAVAPTPAQAAESEPVAAPAPAPATVLTPTDAESISRTLLLAQRTADTTVAGAEQEAASITAAAKAQAAGILDAARVEGRKVKEDERLAAEGEVQALLARRDFLVSDVDHLEQHVAAQRARLTDAAVAIQDLVARVPGGLGEIRRPLLSASDTTTPYAGEPNGNAPVADMTPAEAMDDDAPADDEPEVVTPTGVGELPLA
ncbi:MAG: DivIVA domain-containing protein [Ilumatobacteraceae bacterium]